MGRLLIMSPYASHIATPMENRKYIANEISWVRLVLSVFNAWGRKETVVKKAAIDPINSLISINISAAADRR